MPVVPLYHSPSMPKPVGGLARARHLSVGLRVPLSQVGRAARTRAEVLRKMATQVKSQTAQAARSTRLVGRDLARKERAAARDFRFITDTLEKFTGFGVRLASASRIGKMAEAATQYKVALDGQEDEAKERVIPVGEEADRWIDRLVEKRQRVKHHVSQDLDDIGREFLFSFLDLLEQPANARIRAAHTQQVIEQSMSKFEQSVETMRQAALKPGRSVEQLTEYTNIFDTAVDGAMAAGLMGAVEAGQRKVSFYSSLLTDKLGREIKASTPNPQGGPSKAQGILARLERGDFLGRLDSPQTNARLTEAARRQTNLEKREALSLGRAAQATALEAPQRLASEMTADLDERLLTGRGHEQDYAVVLAGQGRSDAAADYLARVKAAGWAHDWLAARMDSPADALAEEARSTSAHLTASTLAQDKLAAGMLQRASRLYREKLTEDPGAALAKPIEDRLKTMIEAGEVDPEKPGQLVRGLAKAALAVQRTVGLSNPKVLAKSQAGKIMDGYLALAPEERPELINQLASFGRHTGQVLAEAGLDDEVVLAGELLAHPESNQAGGLALAGHLAGLQRAASGRPENPNPASETAQADWTRSDSGRAAAVAAQLQPANENAAARARSLARTAGNLAAEYNRLGLSAPAAVRAALKDMGSTGQPLIQEGRRYLILPPRTDPDQAAALLESALSRLSDFSADSRAQYINQAYSQGSDPALAAWQFDTNLDRLAQTGIWVNADGPGLPGGKAVLIDPDLGLPVSDHLGRPFTVTLAQKPPAAVEQEPSLPSRAVDPVNQSGAAEATGHRATEDDPTHEKSSRRKA